jgi:hypothetical protein
VIIMDGEDRKCGIANCNAGRVHPCEFYSITVDWVRKVRYSGCPYTAERVAKSLIYPENEKYKTQW